MSDSGGRSRSNITPRRMSLLQVAEVSGEALDRGEGVDPYLGAGLQRVDHSALADVDAHMVGLHLTLADLAIEDQVARPRLRGGYLGEPPDVVVGVARSQDVAAVGQAVDPSG